MNFRIVGKLTSIETFAVGGSIRELERLKRHYGKGVLLTPKWVGVMVEASTDSAAICGVCA